MNDFQIGDPPDDRGPIVGIAQDDLIAMRSRIEALEAQLAEAQADRDAAVTAALERAAGVALALGQHRFEQGQSVDEDPHTGECASQRFWLREAANAIRALIPHSGADALSKAQADGMREAAGILDRHDGAPLSPPDGWPEMAKEHYIIGQVDSAQSWKSAILAAIEKGEG